MYVLSTMKNNITKITKPAKKEDKRMPMHEYPHLFLKLHIYLRKELSDDAFRAKILFT